MKLFLVLLVVAMNPGSYTVMSTVAINCNGLSELCNLRINQTTFPGSHNAGSGFDGFLKFKNGAAAPSCSWRNHKKSFKEQLEFGIRYFDVDTCFKDNEAVNCHCLPNLCAFSGSIKKGLKEIDDWMKSNTDDVVIIHFNHDAHDHKSDIAKSIEDAVLELWNPADSSVEVAMNTDYNNHKNWPTLGDAIGKKQRIFLLVHSYLSTHFSQEYDWLIDSGPLIASTWATGMGISSTCSKIVDNAKNKCGSNRDFMDISAFASHGLCTWDMAKLCSKSLGEAQEECYKIREPLGKTVNFLLVDYVDRYKGEESVVNKARFMNQKNIKKFLGKTVFFSDLTGCKYRANKARRFCYKYCPEFGRCWVDIKCTKKNVDVCTQQDHACVTTCKY